MSSTLKQPIPVRDHADHEYPISNTNQDRTDYECPMPDTNLSRPRVARGALDLARQNRDMRKPPTLERVGGRLGSNYATFESDVFERSSA
jgi:hypothetical protein